MPFKIKLSLDLEEDLSLNGFLPESEADRLKVNLENRKCTVTFYVSDPIEQLSMVARDNIATAEGLKNSTVPVHAFTVELDFEDVDSEVIAVLDSNDVSEKTAQFGREVFETLLEAWKGLIEYCRNVCGQFWLTVPSIDPQNYQSFLLGRCEAEWLDSAGRWRRFKVANPIVISKTVMIREGLDREQWTHAAEFITRGRPAPVRKVLLANSRQHLWEDQGRLAVIEAVTALESAIKHILPKAAIRILKLDAEIEKPLDSLFEKAGLRAVTEVVLKAISGPAGLDSDVVSKVLGAIELRNKIIHQAQRKIEKSDAQRAVNAIGDVIERLEYLARS